jgi:hypothetical protein
MIKYIIKILIFLSFGNLVLKNIRFLENINFLKIMIIIVIL